MSDRQALRVAGPPGACDGVRPFASSLRACATTPAPFRSSSRPSRFCCSRSWTASSRGSRRIIRRARSCCMRFLFGGVVALMSILAAGAPRIEREDARHGRRARRLHRRDRVAVLRGARAPAARRGDRALLPLADHSRAVRPHLPRRAHRAGDRHRHRLERGRHYRDAGRPADGVRTEPRSLLGIAARCWLRP